MTVSIHQPNFIPWLGYFFKISQSDVFVILDNVQYTKNGFTNRNRIKTSQGEHWLTLPVIQSGKSLQNIKDCRIFNKEKSTKKIINSIQANYAKAPFFNLYFENLKTILSDSNDSLSNTNIQLIKWVITILGIETKILIASDLEGITGESTERLVSICRKLEATKYLAGLGAKKYQEDHLFSTQSIDVINSPFNYPAHSQLWGDFIPNLSILDVLFNCGEETRKILH